MSVCTIFAHRGLWSTLGSQNSAASIKSASDLDFGIETDLRAFGPNVILSHDVPVNKFAFNSFEFTGFRNRFALNIKEDGLQGHLQSLRTWMLETNSFLFDGSIPEMLKYRALDFPLALRLSEFEKTLPWSSEVIWLDAFHEDWWLKDLISKPVQGVNEFVVVSPELHGRDPRYVWDFVKETAVKGSVKFSICTDRPLEFQMW